MKKLITLTIALFLLAAGNVFGQEQAEVAVSADVEAAFTVANQNDVQFGTIQAGLASTLPASGSTSTAANIGNDAAAGEVLITGGSIESSLFISWNTDVELNRDGETDEIGFTPEIYASGTDDEDGELTDNSGSEVVIADDAGSPGDITLSIGGVLDAISQIGSYSTQFGTPLTITVVY